MNCGVGAEWNLGLKRIFSTMKRVSLLMINIKSRYHTSKVVRSRDYGAKFKKRGLSLENGNVSNYAFGVFFSYRGHQN